ENAADLFVGFGNFFVRQRRSAVCSCFEGFHIFLEFCELFRLAFKLLLDFLIELFALFHTVLLAEQVLHRQLYAWSSYQRRIRLRAGRCPVFTLSVSGALSFLLVQIGIWSALLSLASASLAVRSLYQGAGIVLLHRIDEFLDRDALAARITVILAARGVLE